VGYPLSWFFFIFESLEMVALFIDCKYSSTSFPLFSIKFYTRLNFSCKNVLSLFSIYLLAASLSTVNKV